VDPAGRGVHHEEQQAERAVGGCEVLEHGRIRIATPSDRR
jgi:hypothetical protein